MELVFNLCERKDGGSERDVALQVNEDGDTSVLPPPYGLGIVGAILECWCIEKVFCGTVFCGSLYSRLCLSSIACQDFGPSMESLLVFSQIARRSYPRTARCLARLLAGSERGALFFRGSRVRGPEKNPAIRSRKIVELRSRNQLTEEAE